MRRIIFLVVLALLLPFANSCSIDDGENFQFVTLQIVDAELPEFFEPNQTYEIRVTYIRPDGCTFFQGFDVTKRGQTDRDVVAIGGVLDNDTACTQAIEEVEASFQFMVLYDQEYHFRFYAGDDTNGQPEYLEFTVPIAESPTGN